MYSIEELKKLYLLPDDARVYNMLNGCKLPFNGILIEDVEHVDGVTKEVTILAPIYVNKKVKVTHSYDLSFSDHQILNCHYLVTKFINLYGAENLKKEDI